MKINVLRLDHRRKRDARITTHVCLTARAFGADKVILSGDEDKKLMENVGDVVGRWGGDFKVDYRKNSENFIEEWKNNGGEVIHLTMYGSQVQEVVGEIQNSPKDKLVIVGGARVPTKVYKQADWNVSVTTQPHSEVSSLAVFLHMLFEGKELDFDFEGGKMKVVPTAEGKRVIINDKENI
ncbi:MAG: tRNA (cytidine(56)-2'-O)-methyltransferase [Methanobacterium sp.]|uniref:tRNA (cytidine(56)-2'-O)-methyltransferase n=1 Tax=Methanobacterium sp. TaxID=2164 RepID=UPI003D649793|nr:tRNA (cytidine(56)-2'-O)-methyltransferase [Methanobacterium sp.]